VASRLLRLRVSLKRSIAHVPTRRVKSLSSSLLLLLCCSLDEVALMVGVKERA